MRSRSCRGIYRASRRLGRRSVFRSRPPSLSNATSSLISFILYFFRLPPFSAWQLERKIPQQLDTQPTERPFYSVCARCCCSFPLCFLLLLFSFDFIISKVTALGARTTTTFYLMSWFWLFDIQENKTKKRATTCAQEFAHRFRFFLPSFKCFCVWTVSEIYSR